MKEEHGYLNSPRSVCEREECTPFQETRREISFGVQLSFKADLSANLMVFSASRGGSERS